MKEAQSHGCRLLVGGEMRKVLRQERLLQFPGHAQILIERGFEPVTFKHRHDRTLQSLDGELIFAEVIMCAQFHGFDGNVFVSLAGQHDDRQRTVELANFRQQLQPVHGRHLVIEHDEVKGRPVVAGTRVRVTDILEMLAGGADEAEIVADFPYVTAADIRACLAYAASVADHPVVIAAE